MTPETDDASGDLLEEVLRTGALKLRAADAVTPRGRRIAALRDQGLICQILGGSDGRSPAVFIITQGGMLAWRSQSARTERRILRRG